MMRLSSSRTGNKYTVIEEDRFCSNREASWLQNRHPEQNGRLEKAFLEEEHRVEKRD